MEGGRIVESGTHDELVVMKDSKYMQLVRLQLGGAMDDEDDDNNNSNDDDMRWAVQFLERAAWDKTGEPMDRVSQGVGLVFCCTRLPPV